ncbi:MAG: cation diffusion facilitator family transporter [Treponema sp.]|nr:cation diffusion facilitator family transporter [Treponema sp.]MCL2271309.1 cation diffusion facilitator family transporter [Treponema sp.]
MSKEPADINQKKAHIIKIASLTALFGNTALAAVKITAGINAGSLAVIGDGIDSSVDVFIAVMSLVVAKIISRPADETHPWGHGRAETIATAILSFLLFFAGAQLIFSSAKDIIFGVEREVPSLPALVVTLVSIAGKLFLAWSLFLFGKKADSAMLKANAKNMSADVLLSVGVLAGLGLSMIFNVGLIDSWAALLVGIWVIKSAIEIFLETNTELMDGGSDKAYYRLLFDAVNSVEEAGRPHRVRMRRIAGLWDIDVDIEVAPNKTVIEAHWIAYKVEEAIKSRIHNVYDIMVHVEPAGNLENEGFGLCETTLEKNEDEEELIL